MCRFGSGDGSDGEEDEGMQEFGTLGQMLIDILNTHNAWITLVFRYGGHLLIGVVVGKVVCAIDWRLGAAVAIIAALSIVGLYGHGGGRMLYPIIHPSAWVGWGVLVVCGRRWYKSQNR